MKEMIKHERRTLMAWGWIISLFLIGCSSGGGGSDPVDDELAQVRRQIQDAKAAWTAENNSISALPAESRRRRVGTLMTTAASIEPLSGVKNRQALPSAFDWRHQGVVTPVKNQGDCGADWAFAAVAALEAKILIASGQPAPDLSEQKVLACAGSCAGGYADAAADFLRDLGAPAETCGPYRGADQPCGEVCPAPETDPIKIKEWRLIPAALDEIQQALHEFGPLVVVMAAYMDFFYYRAGIYTHVGGVQEGYLSVLLVGWNDAESCFIAKNSWGENWGEGGYFRIAYAELTEGRFATRVYAYFLPEFHPPSADAGADQAVVPGTVATLSAAGSSDPDGDIVSYFWEQTAGTSVILANANTVNPAFTAPSISTTEETLTFRLTVTDAAGLQASDTCQVVITAQPNHPPAALAGIDQSVTERDRVKLDGSASSDPEQGQLSYRWTQTYGTEVALSDPTAANPEFIAPAVSGPAKVYFQLEVTDPLGLTDTDSVMIVIYPNQSPIARAGADQFVHGGSRVLLDGAGSVDSERRIVTYRWTQTAGPTVRLEEAQTAVAYFLAPAVGASGVILAFRLEVVDHLGASSQDDMHVVIAESPIDQNRAVCPSDCKLLINICSCPEACEFAAGWVIGIDLQILTPGVYWAEDPNVAAFPEGLTNCYEGTYQLGFSRYNSPSKACSATTHTHSLKIAYYDDQRRKVNGPGASAANRAKIVRTPTPYDGYELINEDIINHFCDLWIDMPAMTIIPGEVNPGSQVVVRMSLLSAPPLTAVASCHDADYLRPITAIAPPGCQLYNSGAMGDGDCQWRWSTSFCPSCGRNCYCDKILGPICCGN